MKKFTLKSLLIIAFAIVPMTIFAQEKEEINPYNYFFVGIEGGATQLFGDNQPFKMDKTSWDANLHFGYVFKNQAYFYGNVGYADLKGKYDKFFTIDEANLYQASINVGYDVLQLFKLNPHRLLGIVPHAGWGVINHKATIKYEDGTIVKNGYKDGNPGKGIDSRRNVFQTPLGINFIFNFTKHFQANIDVVAVQTATNGLDARQSGKHDDWYSYANIGLSYKFGNKEHKPCPECEPAAPDCDACADAIRQAVKDAVDEALKNQQPCEEPAKAEAAATEAAAAVPFKNIDLDLTFKSGSAEVEDSEANREEIKEINDHIEAGVQFSTIKVEGYASPEGNDKQNEQLSQDRADATVAYIQNNLGDKVKDVEFESEGMGSDWDGFFKALKNSNISNKAEIEKSIRTAEDPTVKLNELRKQYTELESLLKTLRRTKVSYIE